MRFTILTAACIMLMITACRKNSKETISQPGASAHVNPTPCNTCGLAKSVRIFSPDTVVSGTLTLCADITYILNGKMWINNGGKIVIPKGTVIKGKKMASPGFASALVVTKGGRIEASGDTTCPVIFTSESDSAGGNPKPGDWGGVVILGKSIVNTLGGTALPEGIVSAPPGIDFSYGGGDIADNSGWLKFVRIQYAGVQLDFTNELNNLTLAGVGCGTILDHVESIFSAFDGFGYFGGSVNGKYLLSVSNVDDQFDFDLGYQGNLQYVVGICPNKPLNYYGGGTNGSSGIECKNNSFIAPYTRPVISNMTMVGPENCTAQSPPLLYAAHFMQDTRFVIRNSILYNFPTAVKLTSTPVDLIDTCGSNISTSYFFHNIVYGCTANYSGWLTNPTGQHVAGNTSAQLGIRSPNSYSAYFNAILRGLEPNAAPANTGTRFCGLLPANCAFTYSTTPAIKGGAVDANGKYWLREAWVASN